LFVSFSGLRITRGEEKKPRQLTKQKGALCGVRPGGCEEGGKISWVNRRRINYKNRRRGRKQAPPIAQQVFYGGGFFFGFFPFAGKKR